MEINIGEIFEHKKDKNYRLKIIRITYGISIKNNKSRPSVIYAKVLSKGISALEKDQTSGWPFSVFAGGFKKINKNKIYDDLVKKLNNC